MKLVQAEGTQYLYFTRADGLPGATVMGLEVRGFDPFMLEHLAKADDVRLVLTQSFVLPGVVYIYYLHWDDRSDLFALDRRVEDGTYTDEGFRHAAKTLYQETICDQCRTRWHTLVIPTGDPYIDAPGLEDIKVREHTVIHRCPNCGTYFRQLVVKIFGAAEVR